jgi:hypothetical protein
MRKIMIDDTIEIPIFVPKPRVFNGMEGDETLALPSHHNSIGKNKMAKLRPCPIVKIMNSNLPCTIDKINDLIMLKI